MNKRTLINMLLALVCLAGQAQTTKSAVIKGYSPALKDGTKALCLIDMTSVATDSVRDGRFTLTVAVESLTSCMVTLEGEGCPNYLMTLYLAPDATVSMTGSDCLYPKWKVESPLPEQTTANRITEHCRSTLTEFLQLGLAGAPWKKQDSVFCVMEKQQLDILPSLPIDQASLDAMAGIAHHARNDEIFPYKEQLKEVEGKLAEKAPKAFEERLAYIHSLVYPPHILQPGDAAVDADFFDMQGKVHHLSELQGRYVLLDFWSLGCGPCRMAEPEMRKVCEDLKGRLEIVGINRDKPSAWQESDWSKKIVWHNWSDGKMGKGGIENHYCDNSGIPYYVLLSPDHRVVWKFMGYVPGLFSSMAEAIKGPKQNNGRNIGLAIRKVEMRADGTAITFRRYGSSDAWFRIDKGAYLEAAGKRYMIKETSGITLNTETFPKEKATDEADGILSKIFYADFTIVFEPFDAPPASFDFKEGDKKGDFVILNITP